MAAGDRLWGSLLLARSGLRLNRHAATTIVRRLAKKAGITRPISPLSLQTLPSPPPWTPACRSSMCRSQARHSDPRTTARYDNPRARHNLDRPASYIELPHLSPAPPDTLTQSYDQPDERSRR